MKIILISKWFVFLCGYCNLKLMALLANYSIYHCVYLTSLQGSFMFSYKITCYSDFMKVNMKTPRAWNWQFVIRLFFFIVTWCQLYDIIICSIIVTWIVTLTAWHYLGKWCRTISKVLITIEGSRYTQLQSIEKIFKC